MTEENKNNNNQEEVNKKMRKQFTNTLLNSNLDKRIVSEILGDEKNFILFFNIYLLGCKDMYANIAALQKSKEEESKLVKPNE